MSTTPSIVFCEKPIITSLAEWLNSYIGRISVGKKVDNRFEILAYSDDENDSKSLHRYAKDNDATYITSTDSDGVTAID